LCDARPVQRPGSRGGAAAVRPERYDPVAGIELAAVKFALMLPRDCERGRFGRNAGRLGGAARLLVTDGGHAVRGVADEFWDYG